MWMVRGRVKMRLGGSWCEMGQDQGMVRDRVKAWGACSFDDIDERLMRLAASTRSRRSARSA